MAGCEEAFTFFVRVDQGEGKSGRNHIPSLIGNYLLLYKEGRLDNKRAKWPLVVLLKKHRVRATMLGDASFEVPTPLVMLPPKDHELEIRKPLLL